MYKEVTFTFKCIFISIFDIGYVCHNVIFSHGTSYGEKLYIFLFCFFFEERKSGTKNNNLTKNKYQQFKTLTFNWFLLPPGNMATESCLHEL